MAFPVVSILDDRPGPLTIRTIIHFVLLINPNLQLPASGRPQSGVDVLRSLSPLFHFCLGWKTLGLPGMGSCSQSQICSFSYGAKACSM
jgi:hypothetical protein